MQAEAYAKGRPIEGSACYSLRLYHMLKSMKWNHLPVAGGIYDQHPGFLDDMSVIMDAEADAERKREAKRKREAGKTQK